MIQTTFDLAQILTLLAGIVLPLIVGLVTKVVTRPGVKAIILAALSVGINLIGELANALTTHSPYNLGTALVTGVGTFLVSVGLYYGLWKPTGVAQKAQEVGTKTL